MEKILYAVAVLGALAAIFGLALAVASKVFAVEKDERIDQITAVLPGANCGGCGFPGCGGYASAVVEGKAPTNACAAGGAAVAQKIAEIMGVDAGDVERSVAMVRCSGGPNVLKKYDYEGLQDCLAASRLAGGDSACPWSCLGLGTCVKACPFGAIHVENGVAHVDHEVCVGCMKCAEACPRNVIVKVPYAADVTVACSSQEKGAALRKYCNIGCIGCRMCEKICPVGAITVKDNLARIDYSKCISCGACAQKCPRKLIHNANLRTEHNIDAAELEKQQAAKAAEEAKKE